MHVYIIMGVAGCGKSTVGQAAAKRLRVPFIEADDYHGENNLAKMRNNIPLIDDDRMPWVDRLVQACKSKNEETVILSCSALTRPVRKRLRGGLDGRVTFIHLHGSPRIVRNRMKARQGHYFRLDLLASQYEALHMPNKSITLDLAKSVDELTNEIVDIVKRGPEAEISGSNENTQNQSNGEAGHADDS